MALGIVRSHSKARINYWKSNLKVSVNLVEVGRALGINYIC